LNDAVDRHPEFAQGFRGTRFRLRIRAMCPDKKASQAGILSTTVLIIASLP
jgi:hypothetical protein